MSLSKKPGTRAARCYGPLLLADHQNCKRSWDRSALWRPAAARRRGRRRLALLTRRQDAVRLAAERDSSGAAHRLEILLDFETRRAFLLDDSQSAVAVRAEGFHRRGVECGAIGPAGKREARQNLAVRGAENHHHGLWRLGLWRLGLWRLGLWRLRWRISGVRAGRKEHVVFRVQRQAVASAFVAERIVGDRLHSLYIYRRHAALRILHDDIKHAFAIGDALLGHTSQIDRTEHGAVLRVDYRSVPGWMAENVDSVVEPIEVDAVRLRGAYVDSFDERHCFCIEHGDLFTARKSMPGLRIDGSAVSSDAGDLTDEFQRVKIVDRQSSLNGRRGGFGVRGWSPGRPSARDVQSASGDVGIDVVPAALSADPGSLDHLVRAGLLSGRGGRQRQNCHCKSY